MAVWAGCSSGAADANGAFLGNWGGLGLWSLRNSELGRQSRDSLKVCRGAGEGGCRGSVLRERQSWRASSSFFLASHLCCTSHDLNRTALLVEANVRDHSNLIPHTGLRLVAMSSHNSACYAASMEETLSALATKAAVCKRGLETVCF